MTMAPRNYSSIGIDRDQLGQMKAVKNEWEISAGRKFRWGDFLTVLLTLNPDPPVRFAEMHQDGHPLTEEQLAEMGWEPDDNLTLEVAAMTGGRASLS